MTPKQKYLLDLNGYLHIPAVLTSNQLKTAQLAVDRCIDTPEDKLTTGRNFAFDKSLETLALHPKTFSIIKALTDNKPRLNRGTLAINTHEQNKITQLHCAREDCGWQTRRYLVKNGQIFCNDIVVFFYFTDVLPGDGGLVVLPGSHKSEFERPTDLFFPDLNDTKPKLHPALKNITPKAGDAIILTELTTHGVLVWLPKDRDRRFLILRYKTQYFQDERGHKQPFSDEIIAKLSEETKELVEFADYEHTKKIVQREQITFSSTT